MAFFSLYNFTNLLEDEKILFTIRRHRFVYFQKIFWVVFVFFIFLSILLTIFFYKEGIVDVFGRLFFNYGVLIFIFLGLIISFYQFIRIYINWKYDRFIITNKRIVFIDQHFLFSTDVIAILISDIVNLHSFHKGVLSSLLKFGSIIIETNASDKDCTIRYIPDPNNVIKIIQNLKTNPLYYDRLCSTEEGKNSKECKYYNDKIEKQENKMQDAYKTFSPLVRDFMRKNIFQTLL